MERKLLQKGDLIRLEKGMRVYAPIPLKFIIGSLFSEACLVVPVDIGKVYRAEATGKEEILDEILEEIRDKLCDDEGKVVTNEAFRAFVDSLGLNLLDEEYDASVFAGIYRVYETELLPESLPYRSEALQVYCEKVNSPDVRVWFFQCGDDVCGNLYNIEPIGHVD